MKTICTSFLFIELSYGVKSAMLWGFAVFALVLLVVMLYLQVRKHKRLTFEISQLAKMKRHTVEHEMVLKAMKLMTWRLDVETRQITYDSDFRDAPDCLTPPPGTPLEEFVKHFSPHDAPRVYKKLNDMCEGRLEEYHEQHQVKSAHSDQFYWTESFATIAERDSEGVPLTIVGTAMRIDERKQMEADLVASRIKAEESDRLKSAFLDNISHEIRTPLNAIVGFSGVLPYAESEEERTHLIGLIQENNDKLLKIFNDMVNMSSIEAGETEVENTLFDLNHVISELVNNSQEKIEDKPVVLTFDRKTESLMINSDVDRVKGILSHFIDNAIKFTERGHIILKCEDRANDMLRISVKDTGKGIPEEDLDRIFDRFVKLDVFVQGVGLGLPVCRSFAHAIGGRVGVESQLGKGSTFWLELPSSAIAGT